MASGFVVSNAGTTSAESSSCSDVVSGVGVSWFSGVSLGLAGSCSSDPVGVGTLIRVSSGTSGNELTVSSITATPRNEMLPYKATSDDYAAVTLIWASILTAACVVMGAKWIYRLFRERGEE